MLYAFRHSMQGQIISYRGNYFVVDNTEGAPLGIYPEKVKPSEGGEIL